MTTLTQTSHSIIADAHFLALRDHIISSTGLVFYADRPEVLAGYVADRIKKRGIDNCYAYWELLQDASAGEVELDALIELLSIGETHFFRHRELFDAVRDVALPQIIERNRTTRRLRVWSAGCSTGPEAYSVSILLRRDLRQLIEDWNISILGTDINRPFLTQAAEGQYEEWAFRGTSAQLRNECFTAEGKIWRIAPRFQAGVTFEYHNLVRHPFPSLVRNLAAFDLIFCRNVLIYFAPEIVEQVVSQLADCLVPGGWLAVGHAEHGVKCLEGFEAVSVAGATLYRKRNDLARSVPEQKKAYSGVRQLRSFPERRTAATVRPCDRGRGRSGSLDKLRDLADQGQIDAALQLCGTLIASNPLQANCYFYQALLLDQVAGHEAVLDALNRAIYLDREFVLAHYYLGTTLQNLRNAAGAIKSFRNVQRLLAGRNPSEYLPHAEDMTVEDLDKMARLHIEMLGEV